MVPKKLGWTILWSFHATVCTTVSYSMMHFITPYFMVCLSVSWQSEEDILIDKFDLAAVPSNAVKT